MLLAFSGPQAPGLVNRDNTPQELWRGLGHWHICPQQGGATSALGPGGRETCLNTAPLSWQGLQIGERPCWSPGFKSSFFSTYCLCHREPVTRLGFLLGEIPSLPRLSCRSHSAWAIDLLSIPAELTLFFLELNTNGIMCGVCVWLLPFTIMFMRSIHAVLCISHLFIYAIE